MPTFSFDQLHEIASRILRGTGATAEEADIVAGELAGANLVGHDSHGVIRLKQYADHIAEGFIKPGKEVKRIVDQPGIAVLDGGWNFGQVVATAALDLACERAKEQGTFTVLCRNCCHVGRVGSYTFRAAQNGFAAMMAVNSSGRGGVVPWGGAERRLSTNPISMAAPWGDQALTLDMTTSATAEGKVRVAFQKGESVPEGWLIDADGNPTTNPADLYADPPGAILPLGGSMGFKGYGLNVMVDVFCGILTGAGTARTDVPAGTNGVWLYLIDIKQVMPIDDYTARMEKYVTWVKSAKKAPGFTDILMPGEIELQRQATRRDQGVDIPDKTWQQTVELADKLGVSLEGI